MAKRRQTSGRVLNPARMRDPGTNALRRRGSLTASGARLAVGSSGAQQQELTRQRWQQKPWFYYDNVGAIKQAAQFYARGLSMLELYAAELVPNTETGRPEVVPSNDPRAVAALERIRDPGGGRTNLLSSYGRLMFLVGEAMLFVSANDDGMEKWEMLSADEIRKTDSGYERTSAPAMAGQLYREPAEDDWAPINDETAVGYRLWRRHPHYSQLPDSPMQAVVDTAEELLMLTQAVRARIRSRLAAAGILLFDDSISPLEDVPAGEAPPSPEDAEADPFLADLTEAMTTPIEDEGSASAVVPLTIRVKVGDDQKLEDLVYHLKLVDPQQIYPEVGMREDGIKRLAIELDMPVEALLGLQDSNHWSAWMVDDDTWKVHLQPIAQQLVEDLSSAYYRPTLKEEGVDGWERFMIAYDETKVVSNPNKGKDAKDVHDRGSLSDRALRVATGFDESDAPDEDERRVWIAVHARDTQLAITGVPSSPAAAGGHQDTVDSGIAPEEVVTEPPPEDAAVASASYTAARVLGVCDLALLRAREAAGNRLLSLAKRDAVLTKRLRRVDTGQVAATLSAVGVESLDAPAVRELVTGARPLVLSALRQFGVADPLIAGRIADSVERHAASTLFELDPRPFPPSFRNYLDGLLTPA